ncbi:hypothetical protein GCM10022420_018520 [Streptomyces iranensis]|uniref:Uncharacterized protein n=1 Tax=Streptomyces iranensis TaxID=576784 RepID=A0A060ZLV9_9ACTN|nr:predicted protein [Streptomyces iranensis]
MAAGARSAAAAAVRAGSEAPVDPAVLAVLADPAVLVAAVDLAVLVAAVVPVVPAVLVAGAVPAVSGPLTACAP